MVTNQRTQTRLLSDGWVSYEIQNDNDVQAVIELFRLQYSRLTKSK
jgi:Family of unknown function (DUF5519)